MKPYFGQNVIARAWIFAAIVHSGEVADAADAIPQSRQGQISQDIERHVHRHLKETTRSIFNVTSLETTYQASQTDFVILQNAIVRPGERDGHDDVRGHVSGLQSHGLVAIAKRIELSKNLYKKSSGFGCERTYHLEVHPLVLVHLTSHLTIRQLFLSTLQFARLNPEKDRI